jgi:polar amino acid transport system substrate-binding protein
MKKWLRYFLFLLTIGCAGGLTSTLLKAGEVLDRIQREGVIRTPLPDIWPPAVLRNASGELDGFDVEVMKELSKRMGLKVEYVVNADKSIITWEEQTSGDWKGRYDIVVNSMTPTAKRAEHLKFPTAYYFGLGVLAVHRDNMTIRTPADASHKRIGALKASQYDQYLRRQPFGIVGVADLSYKIDDPLIVNYDHEEGAYEALAKGDGVEIDGFVNMLPVVLTLIKEGKPFKVVGQPLYRTPQAIAIQPGDEEFAALLKKTIDEMRDDGTLAKLSLKWFEVDLTGN